MLFFPFIFQTSNPLRSCFAIHTDWVFRFRNIFDIKKINVFVLDEADVMIDTQGLGQQSIKLQKELRSDCQMMLFSATYDDRVS